MAGLGSGRAAAAETADDESAKHEGRSTHLLKLPNTRERRRRTPPLVLLLLHVLGGGGVLVVPLVLIVTIVLRLGVVIIVLVLVLLLGVAVDAAAVDGEAGEEESVAGEGEEEVEVVLKVLRISLWSCLNQCRSDGVEEVAREENGQSRDARGVGVGMKTGGVGRRRVSRVTSSDSGGAGGQPVRRLVLRKVQSPKLRSVMRCDGRAGWSFAVVRHGGNFANVQSVCSGPGKLHQRIVRKIGFLRAKFGDFLVRKLDF
ncbi:hypothetical protein C8F04DRAFT_1239345 [Mycena alexandri]|uniref:Uncharacterized protein n=1 Tax=Mycena alexandri TaxID=1745969 RepID=A0AAD6SD02_9AGAR|nr:hypothetical protein C8F04DRAFT_1239345 [Mycena alexandri]